MKMLAEEIAQSMGSCGLICRLCGERNKGCKGCRNDITISCKILHCCNKKNLHYCYECSEYPCGVFPPGEEEFGNVRVQAINHVAKEDGLDKLAEYLSRNYEAGIVYYRTCDSYGDYDQNSPRKVVELIRLGRPQS